MEPPQKKARKQVLSLTLSQSTAEVLTKPKFTEAIDRKMLQRLIDSGVLYRERNDDVGGRKSRLYGCTEEQHIQKLLKRVKSGVLLVTYGAPKCGFGRVSPKGSFSLGTLRKEVRGFLCGDDWWDFDVAKCHHDILLQLCQSNGLPCPALANYVTNREDCLAEVAALFKEGNSEGTRDAAKILFIIVMYGGSVQKWLRDNKDALVAKPVLPPAVINLKREVERISKTMQGYNPVMVKAVAALRKKERKTDNNFDGSFLAYYAQEWERRVLECVFTMMRSKGYITEANDGVLCSDGIMPRKENCMHTTVQAIIKECEGAVLDALGLSLTFTEKSMTKSLLPQIEEAEKAARSFEIPEDMRTWLDTKYMITLPTYLQKKGYFEHFVGKIIMSTEFMWSRTQVKTDAYGCETVDHVLASFDESRLVKAMKHVGSGRFNKIGNETRFVEEWLKDGTSRAFNHVEFAPYNGVFDPLQEINQLKLGPTVYNDFKGYNPHIKAPLPYNSVKYRNYVLREFFALGTSIFEGKRSFFEYYLACVAFKIQYPARKHPYLFILIGKEGTGKTMLMDAIGRVFGEHHFYSTTNPEDLFGTHAEGFVGKLWVNLNEVDGASTMGLQSKVKGAVSEDEMTVNAKCVRPRRAKNYAFMTWITNNYNSFKMEAAAKERRNVVAKGTDEYLIADYNHEFWKQLNAHFRSPEFIRCLYDLLNEMDLSKVDWKHLRRDNLTASYYDLAAQYAPIEAVYFEQLCQKIKCKDMDWEFMPKPSSDKQVVAFDQPIRFLTRDLHSRCVAWAVERNHFQKSQPSQAKFVAQCKHLDLPLSSGNKPLSNGWPTKAFVPRQMHDHIVARKWVEDDEDMKESGESEAGDIATYCRKVVDDLVDKVVHKCGIDARFTFVP